VLDSGQYARATVDGQTSVGCRCRVTSRRESNPQDYRKISKRGRGFSINQVQNGGTDSLRTVALSTRFVLSAPKTATLCKLSLIGMAGGRPRGFTSGVRMNMTTIAFIPKASPGLQRDR
jgi:hypothetical protein